MAQCSKWQQTSANAGKTRLPQIQDRLCADVRATLRKELETHVNTREMDTEDKSSQHFQALEVGMTEIRHQTQQFVQWFNEAGDRMQQTEHSLGEMRNILNQHQQETHPLGGVFQSTVKNIKDELSQEMAAGFQTQMGRLEALLEKRARTE